MTAAVATKGDITVKNVIPKHLEAISAKLEEIGAQVDEFDDAVRVVATKRLDSTQIKTLPYPGISDGYAASDGSVTGSVQRNKHRFREHF